MTEIISTPFIFIKNMFVSFVTAVSLPFKLVIMIAYYLYKFVFAIQFFMSDTCQSLFGSSFGCDIINPNYVFTKEIFIDICLEKFVQSKCWNFWIPNQNGRMPMSGCE